MTIKQRSVLCISTVLIVVAECVKLEVAVRVE